MPGARSFSGFWLSGYAREWGEARVEGVLTLRTFHTAVKNNTRTGKRWSVRLGIVKATGAIRPRRREGAQEGAGGLPPSSNRRDLRAKKRLGARTGLFNSLSISSALSSSAMVTEGAGRRRTTDTHAAVHERRGLTDGRASA